MRHIQLISPVLVALFQAACTSEDSSTGPAAGPDLARRAGSYTAVPLSSASGNARAINNAGDVVGTAALGGFFHAVLWSKGSEVDLGTLHGATGFSEAFDINASRRVVGQSCPPGSRVDGCRAFLWEKGVMTDLGTLGGDNSIAFAINRRGEVVGRARTATGEDHGVIWRDGEVIDLGRGFSPLDINPKGQVVGYGPGADNRTHALLWDDGVIRKLGPGEARGISPAGVVVGQGSTRRGQLAALWKKGARTVLGTVRGWPESRAFAINPSGQVVGIVQDDDTRRPFIWRNGVMRLLDAPPGDGTAADINAAGKVVGDVDGTPMLWTPN